MEAKVTLRVGSLEFSGEGTAAWVAEQLDKFISRAPELAKLGPVGIKPGGEGHTPMAPDAATASKALGAFLREKNATENQIRKFLATAIWLESKGNKRLETGDVTKALRDNNQSRLGNPSQCLARNVEQGYCERDGDKFFVTEEGAKSL